MYDYLKSLFDNNGQPAALTFEQFTEKLGTSGVKLANLADGEYVAKAKYDADLGKAKTERDGLRGQLDTANTTIQSYKDMDIDGIKASAASWEQKYKDETAALTQRLQEQELAHHADLFMSGYQFTSDAAKAGIRALFDKQGFKLGEDGTFLGAKEWMEQQIASEGNKGAFHVETPPEPQPQKNPQFAPNTPPQIPKKRRSLTEIMAEHNKNPNAPINFD